MVRNEEDASYRASQEAADAEDAVLLNFVTQVGAAYVDEEVEEVDGDHECLNKLSNPISTYFKDDDREEDGEIVQHTQAAECSDCELPSLPVFGSSFDVFLVQ